MYMKLETMALSESAQSITPLLFQLTGVRMDLISDQFAVLTNSCSLQFPPADRTLVVLLIQWALNGQQTVLNSVG